MTRHGIEGWRMHSAVEGVEPNPASLPLDQAVRTDALRNFQDLVVELGGDPRSLLEKLGVSCNLLENRIKKIPYRLFLNILETASEELTCPDFGMRLAISQGSGGKVMGPIEVVMKNSTTVEEAFRYCSDNIRVYSHATRFELDQSTLKGKTFASFEIVLDRLPPHLQAVEHAIMLTHLLALDVSNDHTYSKEVWFCHQPLSPPSVYRSWFGCPVKFNQRLNGIFFCNEQLRKRIINPDKQLYEMAASYIDARFPSTAVPMLHQIRMLITQMLDSGACSQERIAAHLGISVRTLQRRLKDEGTSFESLKDGIRKDIAIHCIQRDDIPFSKIAEILGYSENSVFSRSCRRWFSKSPRQLRTEFLKIKYDKL